MRVVGRYTVPSSTTKQALGLCILDRLTTAALPVRLVSTGSTGVINSLVLNCVSDCGCLPEDNAFRRLPIRNPSGGGCLCNSSMSAGYASEVAFMHWIGRRATRNNEHVRYTVPFLIGAVSLHFGVAPSPPMERAALWRREDKLNRLLPE